MYSTWTNSTMALYIPCTASAPITSGLPAVCQLLHFSALKNEDNNKREKRQKLPTRSCDNDHSMCMGHCDSQSGETRERKREKKKRRNQPTFESRRYRLLANKTFSYLFQAFLCRLCLCSMARERLLLEGRAANSPAMAGKHTVWRLVKMLQILTCHVSSDSCLTFVR